MRCLGLMLAIFLLMGMFLGISSPAYADDGDEDSGLDVDIVIVGDNADVEVDVIGEDSEVTVNTTGTEIWINGQNINEPTVIIRKGDSGTSKGWIRKRINQAVGPLYSWFDDAGAVISLTADGLAKVILTIQDQDSQLGETSTSIGEIIAELEAQNTQLSGHEDRLTGLDEKVKSLELQDENTQAFVRDYANYLRADYDRKLMAIVILFSVVAIGLVIGLVILGRRRRVW